MAAAAAPAPGAAFPAGDPRNALYFETVGKLKAGEEKTKAENERVLGTERSNATYKEGLLTQAEPGTYGTNRSRAIREGVSSSGIDAERRGGIATNYANRRYAVQNALKEREGAVARSNKAAEEGYTSGVAGAGTKALAEGAAYLERNPPQAAATPTGPYNPGGTYTATGSPGAGGVQPYEEKVPGGGFVRVGEAKTGKWSRDPATRTIQQREVAAGRLRIVP